MASMRKLRRRLLRWQRYDARVRKLVPALADRGLRTGHFRALRAVAEEENRRCWAEAPEVWLGGPEGERALIDDVVGSDPYAGYGPCFCVGCIGHGRCEHDELDEHDDAWDDEPVPYVVTERGLTEAGLL